MDFGTGVVKITPAHDPNDFEVGNRHNLPRINVMNDNGTMNELAGKYNGMDRFEARKAIVKDLDEQGYLVEIEKMIHSVGHSERTGVMVEPRLSTQWFVKMQPLAQEAIDNQSTEDAVEFYPPRFNKTFLSWMENVHDWVISRQLWWGHRIPAWYHKETGEMYVGVEEPKDMENWVQDPDVLDTWFSSALWPFSTMGWPDTESEDFKRYFPNDTLVTGYDIIFFWVSRMIFQSLEFTGPDTESEDFKRYFPNDTLVTGYDIIFFWVSRMIFQSLEFTGRRPFKNVLLHGLIRAEDGRKMSKSLGNGIDPMDVIEKYGADALRWFLSTGSAPGQDVRFSYEKMDAAWNFINKIWNASRFVLMNTEDMTVEDIDLTGNKSVVDKWILTRLNETVAKVTDLFDKFEFGEVGRALYNFIWDDFCDWYIEMSKEVLYGDNEEQKLVTRSVLLHVLDQIMRLLHPIMPFVTEKIWLEMPHTGESLVTAEYPVVHEEFNDQEAADGMAVLVELIRSVRNIRAEVNTPLSKKITLMLKPTDEKVKVFLTSNTHYIERFTNPEELIIDANLQAPELAMSAVITGCEVYLPLADLINVEEEIARLSKEQEKWEKEVKRVEGKLSNERFVSKAPEKVVEEERQKGIEYQERLNAVKERIETLKNL